MKVVSSRNTPPAAKPPRLTTMYSPVMILTLVVIACILIGGGMAIFGEHPPYRWMNFTVSVVFTVSCGLTTFFVVWRSPQTIWTPFPWFLLSVGLFYGFGPLYYFFASDSGLAILDRIWEVDDLDLWRTTFVTLIGTLSILLSFLFSISLMKVPLAKKVTVSKKVSEKQDILMSQRLVVLFLGIALPIRYLLVLPYEFGLLKFVLPGLIKNLFVLIYIALILVAYLSVKKGGRWRLLLWALFGLELVVGLLTFSKTSLLFVPMTTALGFFLARQQITSLISWAVLLVLLYVVTKPLISQSRVVLHQAGLRRGASLGKRVEVMQNAATDMGGAIGEDAKGDLGWWSRLNYATFQAYVISQYNSGESGTSLQMIPYVFIPRLVWPDKPVMTAVGQDFTEELFGHRSSSTGIGVFGESYWNGGFGMLILICCYIGLVYAVLSWSALWFLFSKQWIFLPLILMGIRTGLAADHWIVPAFFGGLVIYTAYFVMFSLINIFLRKYLYPQVSQPTFIPSRAKVLSNSRYF